MEKKNSLKLNKTNYILGFLMILFTYLILQYSIIDDGIFSYKASIYINILIYILFALSINITTGVMGELNLGHAGFISIGAYSSSIFSKYLYSFNLNHLLHLVIVCIFGAIIASFFGMLVSMTTLRLRGDYLAIITLAFGEIVKYIIQNIDFLGGAAGLNGIPDIVNFSYVFLIVVISSILMIMILISKKGRLLLSIRENEIAAENMGVNINRAKIYGFTLSAFFAGIGGALFAHNLGSLTPDKFNFVFSIEILVMVVLGGLGSITGAVVSATFLTLLNEILRQVSEYRFLIYSIILISLMIFKKDGILGTNEFTIPSFLKWLKDIKQKVIK
ncbi:branched-chain amino acid ABC transporter permease [Streptobacillus moniliformis]|uniref:branched-chain amino acid ABC transporter permease n=1 Tax=Streptobacillus moniliformis TaxID=34105 RepID=UPI0007E326AD|nr:branched-chain amino acid ABC transporter permease [Streptobacillus moniliformis]